VKTLVLLVTTMSLLGACTPGPAPGVALAAPEPAMSDSPRARYESWLSERAPGAAAVDGPVLGRSPYALFSAAAKAHPAAVSSSGLVAPKETSGWGPFLTSATPAIVQAQIAWLHGSWVAHAPGSPASAQVLAKDEKAKKYVADPKVETRADGTVVFEAFYGEPPSMDPFRFRVEVSPKGTATFGNEPVWKLP
jgi:hypothetical protein